MTVPYVYVETTPHMNHPQTTPPTQPPVVTGGGHDGLPEKNAEPSFTFTEGPPPAMPPFAPARFTGSGRELLKLHIGNCVYSLLTLGVYSFWGKVRIRRYLWEHTLIMDEPLEYTGTGGELFRSFFIVMLLLALLGAVYYALDALVSPYLAPAAAAVLAVPLSHLGIYLALRYRLTRTRWRGICADLAGSSLIYALWASGYSLLSFITGGLFYPLQKARLIKRRANVTFFGDRRFAFTGKSLPLYKAFFRCAFLALLFGLVLGGLFAGGAYWTLLRWPELGALLHDMEIPQTDGNESLFFCLFTLIVAVPLSAAWMFSILYKVAQVRWFFSHLAFGQTGFSASRFTAWRLCRLTLGNIFLILLTGGFGMPWATARLYRFAIGSLDASGPANLGSVSQSARKGWSGGEGLVDALNVDIAL